MMKILRYTFVIFLMIGGLGLIVAASSKLPESAQEIVTGRTPLLMDQLIDRVGEDELLAALVSNLDLHGEALNQPGLSIDVEFTGFGIETIFDDESDEDIGLDDVINSGLGIENIFQQAVNAHLLTQAEAAKMLENPTPR